MSKKRIFICEECVYCSLEEKDKDNENFAPCLANPPNVTYDPVEKKWLSSRPYTNIKTPGCRFFKRK